MKKISLIFLIFILMIMSITISVHATENSGAPSAEPQITDGQPVESQPQGEEAQPGIPENSEPQIPANDIVTIQTIGRVIKTNGVKEVESGEFKDRLQEITIEIIKGDYIGEEYTTTYNLSYDIEGKIQAYELEVGDKVTVEIVEENGNTTVTVQDVARSSYIIWMFIVFLLSIVVVGGKSGVKAIIGLLLTIIFIYVILIKNVFEGQNAIGLAIGTAMLVIAVTFIVIGGINKKILTIVSIIMHLLFQIF